METEALKKSWRTGSKKYRAAHPERIAKYREKTVGRRRVVSRAAYVRNPDRARNSRLQCLYGISPTQYDTALKRQGGVCAICGNPPKTRRLAVDHDHGPLKTARGLVCMRCNKYRIGINTAATARIVLAYLESGFDIRAI